MYSSHSVAETPLPLSRKKSWKGWLLKSCPIRKDWLPVWIIWCPLTGWKANLLLALCKTLQAWKSRIAKWRRGRARRKFGQFWWRWCSGKWAPTLAAPEEAGHATGCFYWTNLTFLQLKYTSAFWQPRRVKDLFWSILLSKLVPFQRFWEIGFLWWFMFFSSIYFPFDVVG